MKTRGKHGGKRRYFGGKGISVKCIFEHVDLYFNFYSNKANEIYEFLPAGGNMAFTKEMNR